MTPGFSLSSVFSKTLGESPSVLTGPLTLRVRRIANASRASEKSRRSGLW